MGFLVIGAKTLLFLIQALLVIAGAGLTIAAFVWVTSSVIQFVGNVVGFEVGSLWDWTLSKLPRRKDKK